MIKLINLITEKVNKADISFVEPTMNKIRKQLVGNDLGNLEIADILNKAFRKHQIQFEPTNSGPSAHAERNEAGIPVGSIDEKLNIIIEYNEYLHEVFVDNYNWDTFIKVLKNMISHELIHRQQIKKIYLKNFDPYMRDQILRQMQADPHSRESYLANKQEMRAFAQEAVNEFLSIGYNKEQIMHRLRYPYKADSPHAEESDTFWSYINWFEPNSKEIKQFIAYMYKFLKQIK